jgi:diguanylate cyclase (GGDEF)-like protein
LLAQLGSALSPVFVSIVSVEGSTVGPELSRWEPADGAQLGDDELAALTALIPQHLGSSEVPRVLATDYPLPSILRERFGEIVVAPVLTAATELADASGAEPPARSMSVPTAVLLLAAPVESGWPAADIEVTGRLASAIGRRLEGERFIQFQQRRLDEQAALAEIGGVIQAGADADRLYGDFASALHSLVPFDCAYIVRTRDGELGQVDHFTSQGRVRERVEIQDGDADHHWFNAREAISWIRGSDPLPGFVTDEARVGLTLPMRPKGQFLGAVILVGDETHSFSARLAERAVEQLALAVDGTELYRQATERASRIEAHRNLANIVASAADLHSAFDAFAEEIRWLIPFERAVMLTIDEDAGTAVQAAIYPPAENAALLSAPLEGSVLGRVLGHGDAFVLARSDEALAELDWALIGDDAVEVAAVPVRDGERTVAIFALEHNGVADYQGLDLQALEEVAGLLAVTIDRLRLYERAEHAAHHDLLTGLPNYRFLQERLATLRVDLESGGRSAVLMIDMDGLKLYNDTLGHDAGDRAIQRVAQQLRSTVRAEDLVARTGGDEFVVVMEGVSREEALAVSERMHESLRGIHHEFGNAPVPVRISVGLALAPDDGTGASELLEAADRAMYDAKFGGGDRTRAAGGDLDTAPRSLRRRGNRIMELLNRAAVDGATGPERLAVALAQRYVVAVAIGRGLPVDTTDPLRMLVSAEAAHHIEAPEGYRDQETALLLLDGLRAQWEKQADAADLQLSDLLPAAVRLAWEQIPPPDGPGLTAEQALTMVMNDPAFHLGPEVVELLRQSARTAEFERRRSRRGDAA